MRGATHELDRGASYRKSCCAPSLRLSSLPPLALAHGRTHTHSRVFKPNSAHGTSSVSTVLEAGSTVSEATVVLVAGRHARRAASSCCSAATCSRSARLSSSSPHTPARAGSSRCSAGCRTAQISSALCCARPMCAWAIAMCCVSSPPPADPGEDLGPPPGKPAILRDVTAAKAPRHRRTFLRRGNLEGPIYEGPTSLPAASTLLCVSS